MQPFGSFVLNHSRLLRLDASGQLASTEPPHTNPAQLPTEIHDQIIDYLWNDLPALKACSLACRSWLPTVRTYMFDSLDARSSNHTLDNYKRRLEQYANISVYVRTLIASDLDVACVLLTVLNNVVHLQLAPPNNVGGHLCDNAGEWARDGQGRKFSMIKTVRVEQWTVDLLWIQKLVLLFPSISALFLRDINAYPPATNPQNDMNVKANDALRLIPQLSIMSTWTTVAAWLLRVLDYERLSNLGFAIMDVVDAELTCSILSGAAHSLDDLTISLSPAWVQASEIGQEYIIPTWS